MKILCFEIKYVGFSKAKKLTRKIRREALKYLRGEKTSILPARVAATKYVRDTLEIPLKPAVEIIESLEKN